MTNTLNKAAIVAAVLIIPALAIAGTGGAEFTAAYTTISGWASGFLGKLLTVGLLVVGIAMGMVRQTIGAVVPAVGAALALQVGPGVLNSIVSAVI